jgi:hypothetical protein
MHSAGASDQKPGVRTGDMNVVLVGVEAGGGLVEVLELGAARPPGALNKGLPRAVVKVPASASPPATVDEGEAGGSRPMRSADTVLGLDGVSAEEA